MELSSILVAKKWTKGRVDNPVNVMTLREKGADKTLDDVDGNRTRRHTGHFCQT